MIYAAAKGAYMNVLINANELRKFKRKEYKDKISYYIKIVEDMYNKINDSVDKQLNK